MQRKSTPSNIWRFYHSSSYAAGSEGQLVGVETIAAGKLSSSTAAQVFGSARESGSTGNSRSHCRPAAAANYISRPASPLRAMEVLSLLGGCLEIVAEIALQVRLFPSWCLIRPGLLSLSWRVTTALEASQDALLRADRRKLARQNLHCHWPNQVICLDCLIA